MEELQNKTLVELAILPVLPKRSIGVAYGKNNPVSIAALTFLDHITNRHFR